MYIEHTLKPQLQVNLMERSRTPPRRPTKNEFENSTDKEESMTDDVVANQSEQGMEPERYESDIEKNWNEEWLEEYDCSEPGRPWYVDSHELVLEPATPKEHFLTLLVLHSCSGGPDDIINFFHRLNVPFRNNIRVVVPSSPIRWENHYGYGKELNSWYEYDAVSEDGNMPKCREQVIQQRERILSLLDRERAKLPDGNSKRIVIWGFSQGAALAVDVALRSSSDVGGVIALRGMALPLAFDELPSRRSDAPFLDVLASNGQRDWLCPPDKAKASYEALQGFGVRLQFESEPYLAHGCARGNQILCKSELCCAELFLKKVWDGL